MNLVIFLRIKATKKGYTKSLCIKLPAFTENTNFKNVKYGSIYKLIL